MKRAILAIDRWAKRNIEQLLTDHPPQWLSERETQRVGQFDIATSGNGSTLTVSWKGVHLAGVYLVGNMDESHKIAGVCTWDRLGDNDTVYTNGYIDPQERSKP